MALPSEPLALGALPEGGFAFFAFARDASGAETPLDTSGIAAEQLASTPLWQLTGLPDIPDGADSVAVAVVPAGDPLFAITTWTYRRPTGSTAVVWLRQGALLAPSGGFVKTGDTWGVIAWKVSSGLTDLTGASVTFSLKDPAAAGSGYVDGIDHKPASINNILTISDGTFGATFAYDPATFPLLTPGTFRGEFHLTFAGGRTVSIPQDESMELRVLEAF